jgi:hypothetical protein
MTWVICFAVLWMLVGSAAGLLIGRGLRVADQREQRRREDADVELIRTFAAVGVTSSAR